VVTNKKTKKSSYVGKLPFGFQNFCGEKVRTAGKKIGSVCLV